MSSYHSGLQKNTSTKKRATVHTFKQSLCQNSGQCFIAHIPTKLDKIKQIIQKRLPWVKEKQAVDKERGRKTENLRLSTYHTQDTCAHKNSHMPIICTHKNPVPMQTRKYTCTYPHHTHFSLQDNSLTCCRRCGEVFL